MKQTCSYSSRKKNLPELHDCLNWHWILCRGPLGDGDKESEKERQGGEEYAFHKDDDHSNLVREAFRDHAENDEATGGRANEGAKIGGRREQAKVGAHLKLAGRAVDHEDLLGRNVGTPSDTGDDGANEDGGHIQIIATEGHDAHAHNDADRSQLDRPLRTEFLSGTSANENAHETCNRNGNGDKCSVELRLAWTVHAKNIFPHIRKEGSEAKDGAHEEKATNYHQPPVLAVVQIERTD
mmetsp:Transcript_21855/g.37517  ORF Transcript_21855/g.37517 Transcript_21855/m.37517 type:complete len:239 (+) Transcript_21855:345-1061(+)